MTRDDIIKLAQESGLHSAVMLSHVTEKSLTATEADQLDAIIDFAERVAKAENAALRAAIEKETAARREAQVQLEAAYEARNRAGIEFRRNAAKENAELRRLHDENAALKSELESAATLYESAMSRADAYKALNAELVGALREIAATDPFEAELDPQRAVRIAPAALAKVQGETK